jgi:hypothetical protein
MNPKDVPVKSRYFYNEVSVYFLLIYANKGGTAKHKPRPFMGLGFFVFLEKGRSYANCIRMMNWFERKIS